MKHVLFILVSIFLMAFVVNGAAPSSTVEDANYVWDVYQTISSTTGFDTIAAAADTIDLLKNHTFEPGWEYMLVLGGLTEASANEMIVRVHCLDAAGTILYTVADIDTFDLAGDIVLLPIGGSAIAHKFTLQILGGAAQSGEGIVNQAYIYRRRSVSGQQVRWR